MPVSQAQLGTLYIPNYHGIAWSQPGGPFTTVYPQEENAPYNPPQNPIPPGQFFCETGSALWIVGCGHGVDEPHVWRDFNTDTNTSCAVIGCNLCSFVQSILTPYEIFTDVMQYPILII
jgi:hypothetical protein